MPKFALVLIFVFVSSLSTIQAFAGSDPFLHGPHYWQYIGKSGKARVYLDIDHKNIYSFHNSATQEVGVLFYVKISGQYTHIVNMGMNCTTRTTAITGMFSPPEQLDMIPTTDAAWKVYWRLCPIALRKYSQ